MGTVSVVSVVHVGAWEGISVVELSVSAVKDGGTWSNHLWCEGKLLAVENQSILAVVDEVLALLALFSETANTSKS